MKKYGLLTEYDEETFDFVLDLLTKTFEDGIINVLELGVLPGDTARGIKNFYYNRHRDVVYHGVETAQCEPPFEGALIFSGDSGRLQWRFPDKSMHLVFVDACNCFNHAIQHFYNFYEKVIDKGLLVFHNTDPAIQGIVKSKTYPEGNLQKYHTANIDDPRFYIGVREALKEVGLLDDRHPQFKMIKDAYSGKDDFGGIAVFQRHCS